MFAETLQQKEPRESHFAFMHDLGRTFIASVTFNITVILHVDTRVLWVMYSGVHIGHGVRLWHAHAEF